jgi:HSP20 family protein
MARNPLTSYRGGLLGGFDPLFSLQRDMNRLFDEVVGGGPSYAGGPGSQNGQGQIINAYMNVSETEHEIRISAELPGVREEDIDVSLNDDVLTIRGEKKFERSDEKENFHFVERSYGTFQRSIRLPFPVDPEQVQARFENGVLQVTLPKSAQQQRTRRIQVQRGSASSQGGGQMIQGEATRVEDQQQQGGGEQPRQQQGGRERKGDQTGGSKQGRQQG